LIDEADNLIAAHHTSANLAAADLSHDEWRKAHAVQLTRYWSGEVAPPSRQAEARIIWTDNALCVRFVCHQDEPLITSGTPQLEHKTLGLWDRDVCEIFVAPDDGNPQRYLEFEAAPTGEWLDLAIEHREGVRETDWAFHSGMTAAARVDASLITIALCLPWAAFGHAPRAGARWRSNLFRCIGTGPSRGYLAWQPTRTPQPNFHVPSAFGWLEFNDE
jgi:hypothetical protein